MATPINPVHLRPTDRTADAWFGDPVPFYWNGVYHLFYVWDQGHLILPRVCHSWGHFVSTDLVNWEELPMAIDPEEEASCGTGTVFEHDGLFHMYYLGRYFTTNGVMHETMCHATSTDLITWTKDPANPFSRPDPTRYGARDWRDGFPIWVPEQNEFWMLITCSLKDGPASRRGCVGLLASKDLKSWEPRDPFWAPYLGQHLECPDLFFWNGWWYLLFSGSYGPTRGTAYRRSRSMTGPWEVPPVDTFDGPLFYAAKTAGDERRRIIFGWIGTRQGDTDVGRVQWGGHGLMREVIQDEQGYLWVKCPAERLELGEPLPAPRFTARLGQWRLEPAPDPGPGAPDPAPAARADSLDRSGLSYTTAVLPRNYLLRCRFTPSGPAPRFGLFLRTDPDLTSGYQLSVEPERAQITITSFGPDGQPRPQPLTRPLPCRPGDPVDLTLFVSDTIIEVFANDRVALAARLYDHRGSHAGLFTEESAGSFSEITVRKLPDETW